MLCYCKPRSLKCPEINPGLSLFGAYAKLLFSLYPPKYNLKLHHIWEDIYKEDMSLAYSITYSEL